MPHLASALAVALPLQVALTGVCDAQTQSAPSSAVHSDTAISAIANIRSATSPSFSPDGKLVAYVSDESGLPQVWVTSGSGSSPVQLTKLPDPVQSVHWSPTGEWLAFEVAPGGGLNVQLYVMRPDGSGVKRLTRGGQDNNRFRGWTRDGRFLRATSAAENPAVFQAQLIDPASGSFTPVGKALGINAITDLSPDGRRAVLWRRVQRSDTDLLLVDLRTGTETVLTPHEGPGTFDWGEFSPDGRRIYVASNAKRDMVAFGVVDLDADGRPSPIRIIAERSDAEGMNAELDDQGRRAALHWNVAGRSELSWLDTSSHKITAGARLPADVLLSMEFSPDGERLAVVASGAATPTDIHLVDVDSGRSQRLTRSRHDGVDLSTFVQPTLLAYQAHDGLPLSGWLYRPRGAQGAGPVVFSYHGGPEGIARPIIDDLTQALVTRGISVFRPNVRGSIGFGKRFANLDNGPLRVNSVRDIKATTDALVKMGIANRKRLGIVGGSYGGYMVMAGVTEFPDMFSAGANLFGVVNFDTFFKHTQPWMAEISKIEYGDPERETAMLASLSPINKLDKIKTPLIVLHGANDTNVPVIEAEQIVSSLRQRGVAVEYVLFPDEGHGWRKLSNRVRSTVSIVNFFDHHLNEDRPK